MKKYTPILNLYKPNVSDDIPIDTSLSENFDKIDNEAARVTSQLAQTETNVNSRAINIKTPPAPLVGAKGDGSNDTQAIKACVNFLNNLGGGRIEIPSGQYYVTETIILKNNNWLFGSAGGSERLRSCRFYTDQPIDIFKVETTTSTETNIRLSGISLDGGNVGLCGLRVLRGIVYLDDCHFERFTEAGLFLSNAWISKIFRCYFDNNQTGAFLGKSSNGVVIRDSRFTRNPISIHLHGENYGMAKVLIDGNSIESSNVVGIDIEGTDIKQTTISNNYFEAISGTHIRTKGNLTGENSPRNLIIEKNWNHGQGEGLQAQIIYDIQAGRGVIIRDNNLFNWAVDGIRIGTETRHVLIETTAGARSNQSAGIRDLSKRAVIRGWSTHAEGGVVTNEFIGSNRQTFFNLLRNGSFENGTEGWILNGSTQAEIITDPLKVKDGRRAIKIHNAGATNRLQQQMLFEPSFAGKTISMTGFIEFDTTIPGDAHIVLESGGGGSVQSFNTRPTENGFFRITGKIPDNATQLDLRIFPDTTGNGRSIIVDGLMVTLGSPLSFEEPKQYRRGGATANRPISPRLFEQYFDATINKIIVWNGTNWVDAMGTTV